MFFIWNLIKCGKTQHSINASPRHSAYLFPILVIGRSWIHLAQDVTANWTYPVHFGLFQCDFGSSESGECVETVFFFFLTITLFSLTLPLTYNHPSQDNVATANQRQFRVSRLLLMRPHRVSPWRLLTWEHPKPQPLGTMCGAAGNKQKPFIFGLCYPGARWGCVIRALVIYSPLSLLLSGKMGAVPSTGSIGLTSWFCFGPMCNSVWSCDHICTTWMLLIRGHSYMPIV